MGTKKDLSKEFPSVIDRAYIEHKKHRKIKEIMTRDVVSIKISATMLNAAMIMGEKHIGSVIIENYSTPVGIVTERDLMTDVLALGKTPSEINVEEIMSFPLITICPDAEIKEAARMMIKKKGRLAVFKCGNLVGVITASDLIRSLPDIPETHLKVDEYMTKDVITADEQKTIASITKVMGEQRIGSVIITSKDKPHLSIFTERDLLTAFLAKGKSLKTKVGKASSFPLITIPAGTSVHKAAAIMAGNHIKRLPVTRDGQLVGIITARDLVEAYAS